MLVRLEASEAELVLTFPLPPPPDSLLAAVDKKYTVHVGLVSIAQFKVTMNNLINLNVASIMEL